MSKLEELLQGVDVEWKTLKKYVKLEKGKQLNKEFLLLEGKYPAYNGGITYSGFTDKYNYDENKIIISQGGASAGFVNFITSKFYANAHCYVVLPNFELVDNKYIYYLLKQKQGNLTNKQHGAGIPALKTSEILQIRIPIPCPDNPEKSLEIQQEIVRVLDELTSLSNQLTTELETERQNRKKQFEFFRTAYLNNQDNEIKWLKLGNLGKFTYGLAASASDFGNTRFVRISDINAKGKLIKEDIKYVNLSDDNKKYLLKKNDLLMARTGATFGKTMIFDEDYDAIYAGFLIKLDLDKNSILPKYYWHFAQSELFWEQANKLVNGGGQPQFNANTLKNVQVPIPFFNNPEKSLEEQERIVKLLDQFDATHTAIEEEITKEIKLRTQQYEYYREKLLSFPQN